jgi:adenine-specific DNA-methyltransferase
MPRIAPYLQSSAKRLRRDQTDAELKFWMRLRSRQIKGLKFRRQHSIGPYIVDFCCLEKKIVVEIDGGQHAEQTEEDQRRTNYLSKCGFRVLRYWNHDVLKFTDVVLEDILNSINRPYPHPSPLPERERGYEGKDSEQ